MVLVVAEREVHVLCTLVSKPLNIPLGQQLKLTQALRGGALVQVINGGAAIAQISRSSSRSAASALDKYSHNDALASAVHGESTNLNAVLVLDRLDIRSLADNLDQLLSSVAVLVNLTNVPGGHLLGEGNVDGQLDTTEP